MNFTDTTGEKYSRETLLGKVVIVNFWATWCEPCKDEIPDLSMVAKRYKGKNVVMLGVMVDEPDARTLRAFVAKFALVYPIVRSDSEVQDAFKHPAGLPTTFVFDRKGNRRDHHLGSISEQQLSATVEELLAEK